MACAKEASAQLAVHFCEDPSTFQLDECFTLFGDFFTKLGHVIVVSIKNNNVSVIFYFHIINHKKDFT